MLGFTSEDLSTLELQDGSFTTKRFDFRDLPCPPQSVMERKWYSPEPGQPYRPFLAAPKQKFIEEIAPWFTNCGDGYFTGYDPPKTLIPAAAMDPTVTSIDPLITPAPPTPSPTQGPGAGKTTAAEDRGAVRTAASPKSKETSNVAAGSRPKASDPGLQPTPIQTQRGRHTESDPETYSINPQQHSGILGHPGQSIHASAPNKAMPTSIAAGNSKNAKLEGATGLFSDPQQTISAVQLGGYPGKPAASSETINAAQQNYAGRLSEDPIELADPNKVNTLAQHNNASINGGDFAEEIAPSNSQVSAQPKTAVEIGGGSREADGTSTIGDPAQTSYLYEDSQTARHDAKTSNPSNPSSTSEGLSSYDPLNRLSDQMSKIGGALASAPQKPSPAQNQGNNLRVGNPAPTSNRAADGGNTEQGAEKDRPSIPEYTMQRYHPSHLLPDQRSEIESALAAAPQKPTSVQNRPPGLQESDFLPPENGSESGNSPLGSPQSSDKPKMSGKGNPRVPVATMSIGGHAAVIGPPGVDILPNAPITGQVQKVDGEIVAHLLDGVSIQGANLPPGALPITVAGTLSTLMSSALVIGTKSNSFASETPTSRTMTIASQAIVAKPAAIKTAGSALSAGGQDAIIGDVTLSLEPGSSMKGGSKAIALASSGTGLGEIIRGGFGAEEASSNNTNRSSDYKGATSSTSMNLAFSHTGPPATSTRVASGRTGLTLINTESLSNITGSSSNDNGPVSVDPESSSTDAAQGSSTISRENSPAPTGEAASPRTGLLWKLTTTSVIIISVLRSIRRF